MPQHNERVVKNSNDLNDLGKPDPPKPVPRKRIAKPTPRTYPPKSVQDKILKGDEPKQKGPLANVAKHFDLKTGENDLTLSNPDDKDIQDKVKNIQTKFQNMTKNGGNTENLKNEAILLASAQNALDEVKEEPTKEALEKKLEERREEKTEILQKLEDLGAIDSSNLVDGKKIQGAIESNNKRQTSNIDNEIEVLEALKDLKGLQGSDIKGDKKLDNEVKDEIDDKIKKKKDEKESNRKKHWWERIFFHNNKKDDESNTTVNSEEPPKLLKKLQMDLSSPEVAFFIYFCFVSIAIFTITLFTSYNNPQIYSANEKLMKQTQGFYSFGLVVLILFLISLSLSYGHDKDIKQKIASFILLNGTIYIGAFYTYLESNGSFVNLDPYEKLASRVVVAAFIIFLLGSVAFFLSEKRKGKIGRILGIAYLLTCIIGFFILGGVVTSFNARLTIPKGESETFLVPLCTGLFIAGILLLTSAVLDSIPSVNKEISSSLNTVINILEPTKVKLMIVAGLVMSIYYTITLYKAYGSKYISGDPSDSKFPDKKDKGVNKLIEPTYMAGTGLIVTVIFSLSLSFGGSLKEKAAAIFLTFFVIFCGSYLTYLEGESKINNKNQTERSMVIGTIVVFMILLVACVLFVLFAKRSGNEILIQDGLKIVSSFGALGLFFYMFGINTAVVFSEFLTKHSGSTEGKELWTGFGIGLAVILLFIYSFFI